MDIISIKESIICNLREKFASVMDENGNFKSMIDVYYIGKNEYGNTCFMPCLDLISAMNKSKEDLMLFVPIRMFVIERKNYLKYSDKYILINYTKFKLTKDINYIDYTTETYAWKNAKRLKDRPVETLSKMFQEIGTYEDVIDSFKAPSELINSTTYFRSNRYHGIFEKLKCSFKNNNEVNIYYRLLSNGENMVMKKAKSFDDNNAWDKMSTYPMTFNVTSTDSYFIPLTEKEVEKEFKNRLNKGIITVSKRIKSLETVIKEKCNEKTKLEESLEFSKSLSSN